MRRRLVMESVMKGLMISAILLVIGAILLIIGIICFKGCSALSLSMLTGTQGSEYYTGKDGGIANAIIGSLSLAGGSLFCAVLVSIPVALHLNHPSGSSLLSGYIRHSLDLLYGIPTVVYGSVVFLVMIAIGGRASLGWGIFTVTLFISPLLIRAFDELFQSVPPAITANSLSLGATHLETLIHIGIKQVYPGMVSAILLAFGRAIGDAASLLFTTGYSSDIPGSLSDPVATLPLAIFFQLNSPFQQVRDQAYTSAVVLLVIVIITGLSARLFMKRYQRYVVR